MRKIISLICLLLPAIACAADPEIRPDAPERHVVTAGDTLWSISNLFFKDPWKWPHLWGANREAVKNPHWIYPGMVIYLNRATGQLGVQPGAAGDGAGGVVRLKPQARPISGGDQAIFSISARVIGPFLARPLAVEPDQLEAAPRIVALPEERVMIGAQDSAFVMGLPADAQDKWQVYQPGKPLIDPDTQEVLAQEVVYLGDVDVVKPGAPATIKVTSVRQEMGLGARLVEASDKLVAQYVPHPPVEKIQGKVISLYGGMTQAGQNTVVTINKGRRDGMEEGHVLALYKAGREVRYQSEYVQLPDERNGLLFIFRVFERVSYGLIMETHLPVKALDTVQTP